MHNDQAAGLRAMKGQIKQKVSASAPVLSDESSNDNRVRVIAVASGKGGVGKTNVSVNLGVALSKMGQKVMVMDADFSLANVDIMLGLNTPFNLSHVINGQKTLREIIQDGPAGLKIIPASSGVKRLANLSPQENLGLLKEFERLGTDMDLLIVDTAAGIADSVVTFCQAADDVLIVVCDEPASITDAYALVKVLSRDYSVKNFKLVVNMSRSPAHSNRLYEKFSSVCTQYLKVSISLFGSIPFDQDLRSAVQKQVPVVISYPSSHAAKAFDKMAQNLHASANSDSAGYFGQFVRNFLRM
ncbi:cobyrinic acid a,c-diamide synthase [Thiomicrospira aerophila AL3]|uniref:Cobyrinic acid a,c-diamide synthase n=1 Tax=Thiomicrospira aerophila AL3 TaxID=717772 RepID=W0DWA5_9GAMM|nr:MinD/ParA family protein [Thiomicrospira aerophila]AHF01563.1 cobyrinic acid a,c-diamide synthase [Thiomicrospira aerophila AL3]